MSDFSYCWSGVHASFEPGHGETLAAGTSFGSQAANDRQTVREPAPGSLDATNRAAPLVDTQSDGSRAACTPPLNAGRTALRDVAATQNCRDGRSPEAPGRTEPARRSSDSTRRSLGRLLAEARSVAATLLLFSDLSSFWAVPAGRPPLAACATPCRPAPRAPRGGRCWWCCPTRRTAATPRPRRAPRDSLPTLSGARSATDQRVPCRPARACRCRARRLDRGHRCRRRRTSARH